MKAKTVSKLPKEIAALLPALQLRGSQMEALQALSDSEWSWLLAFCDLAHLTLPLAQLRKDGIPRWVVERLDRNAADNAMRFDRVKATYAEIANALSSADVKYIVLKGFAQYPEFVKSPQLRMQSDIDLYCPAGEIERASAALLALGYRSEQTQDYSRADHLPTLIRDTGWKWRGNAFDPEMPVSVELHFCMWNEKVSLFSIPEIGQFWDRRVTRVVDDVAFPALSSVDSLGYCAIHVLRNLLAGDWIIHHVYELAAFLHSHTKDEAFWRSWSELHDNSLRPLEAIAFGLARVWFGCDLSPEAEGEIGKLSPAIQKWFRSFAGSPLNAMFHPNKDRLWLYLSLLDSSRAKRTVLRRTLLPTRAPAQKTLEENLYYWRVKPVWSSHPYAGYLFYFVSRVVYHAHSLPATLCRGVGWWVSQRSSANNSGHFLQRLFF